MDIRKSSAINLTAYAAATIGTIIGEVMDIHLLVYICKPLLMVILSSWFYFNSRRVGDRFTLLVQAGLLFSLIGDVALMFQHMDQFNFLIGLGAFLIAQLCYTIGFAHNVSNTAGPFSMVPWLLATGVAAYGTFFAMDLVPRVDETIAIPVSIYAIAISAMGILAAFRYGRTFPRSFLMTLGGALLFIASDSLLATNRFIKPMAHASWSVIGTYALGQFLIVAGCLAHVMAPEEIRRKVALTT